MNEQLPLAGEIKKIYSVFDRHGHGQGKPLAVSEASARGIDTAEDRHAVIRDIRLRFPRYAKHARQGAQKLMRWHKQCARQVLVGAAPPLDHPEMSLQHGLLLDAIGRCGASIPGPESDLQDWATYALHLCKVSELDTSFKAKCWSDIERVRKFRYDVWRYYITIWAFAVALIVFLFVNVPLAFKNIRSGFMKIQSYMAELVPR